MESTRIGHKRISRRGTRALRARDLRRYKEFLEAKEKELLRRFPGRNQIALQRTAELEEEAQLVVEQDLAVQNRNLASDLVRQVREAWERIADGSYGICVACGRVIQRQRLEAVPWAARCVPCQESLDLQQIGSGSSLRQLREWEYSEERAA